MTRTDTATCVVATGYGDPDVLELTEQPLPEPGPGQVRIAVRAAGTNPVDRKIYSGAMGADPAKLPLRLGFEVAGVVESVADGVAGPLGPVRPGEEVIAFRIAGGYADRVVVAADTVLPKPATLSFEQAAGLMLTGATAVHALTAVELQPGETVLVHGGSGGVGHMVVQLAVDLGARVIATASPGEHDYLRGLGAEPLAYGDGLVDRVRATAPDGVAAAVDTVGTDEAVDSSVELVADRSRIVSIAAFGRAAELGIKLIGNGPGADPGTEVRAAARGQLVELAAAGRLTVRVAAAFPLAKVAEAHRLLGSGHAHGKVVLVP